MREREGDEGWTGGWLAAVPGALTAKTQQRDTVREGDGGQEMAQQQGTYELRIVVLV